MKNSHYSAGAVAFLLALSPLTSIAENGPVDVGNFTINIVDENPEIGFSDPTRAVPIDGNKGRTVGEQRLNAYKHVVAIWDANLDIDTRVVLQASFAALTCTATGGTLGAAGAINVFRDFTGPSFPSTWYGGALANKLAGQDLNGSEPDPGLLAPPFNDEIVTFFNANLGQPGCLENSSWYYGFKNDPPPGAIDFIEVLTHEVGHGLGFQNFANDLTGRLFLGLPDQWTRFQSDNQLGKRWDQMVDFERFWSTGNGPNLVWDGPAVTAEAPSVLGPAQVILITGPDNVAGEELPFGTASFGPALPPSGIQGTVELVDDGTGTTDGCEVPQGFTPGNIALIDRGVCTFVLKAQNAEAAGASAVIIADNVAGATPPGLGGSGNVGITTVSVTQSGGQLLRQFPDTEVDIGAAAIDGSLAGTDSDGRVKLYAPSAIAPGSSVSHFDTSAFPNVLMEPFNTNDVDVNDGDVDLTDELLEEIGWDGTVNCPGDADARDTVILVNGCDSEVENRKGEYVVIPTKKQLFPIPGASSEGLIAGGCFIADLLPACGSVFVNLSSGQYQNCIKQLTAEMLNQEIITSSEAEAIRSCASPTK